MMENNRIFWVVSISTGKCKGEILSIFWVADQKFAICRYLNALPENIPIFDFGEIGVGLWNRLLSLELPPDAAA